MTALVPHELLDLRLPSRGSDLVPRRDRRRLARTEAIALAEERIRKNIQIARVGHVTEVAYLGIQASALVGRAAEQAAIEAPHGRHRGDAMADQLAASVLGIIAETGR